MIDWGYGFDEPVNTNEWKEVEMIECTRCGCQCDNSETQYIGSRILCFDCWSDCGE